MWSEHKDKFQMDKSLKYKSNEAIKSIRKIVRITFITSEWKEQRPTYSNLDTMAEKTDKLHYYKK